MAERHSCQQFSYLQLLERVKEDKGTYSFKHCKTEWGKMELCTYV